MSAGLGPNVKDQKSSSITPTKDVLARPLSGNDKASFPRGLRIDRTCPLQIHLDSLKIDLEKLH
jgi:hypothetical protein